MVRGAARPATRSGSAPRPARSTRNRGDAGTPSSPSLMPSRRSGWRFCPAFMGDLTMSILKKGMQGAPVKRLQAKLGVEADGLFGPATERSLRDFQKSAGRAVDGIAGPDNRLARPRTLLSARSSAASAASPIMRAMCSSRPMQRSTRNASESLLPKRGFFTSSGAALSSSAVGMLGRRSWWRRVETSLAMVDPDYALSEKTADRKPATNMMKEITAGPTSHPRKPLGERPLTRGSPVP